MSDPWMTRAELVHRRNLGQLARDEQLLAKDAKQLRKNARLLRWLPSWFPFMKALHVANDNLIKQEAELRRADAGLRAEDERLLALMELRRTGSLLQ